MLALKFLLRCLVTQYPLAAFCILTFLMSWSVWFLAPVLSGMDRYVFDSLIQMGSFGPAFAAWVVAGQGNPKPANTRVALRITLFVLCYPITLAIWWFGRPLMLDLATQGHWTDFVIAALPALFISGFGSGTQGVRDWLSSMRKWRVGVGPYLIAVLLWPGLIVVGNALAPAFGIRVPAASHSLSWSWLWIFPLNLLCILFYGGGNEEPGWRGFAQPLLQKKYSPLMAGLIIGAIWAVWHMPLNLNGYYSSGAAGLLTRLFTIPYGVFFAWMFIRSRGSLIPVWLLHGMSNNSGAFFPRADIPVFGLGVVLLICLVIKDRMWKRPLEWALMLPHHLARV